MWKGCRTKVYEEKDEWKKCEAIGKINRERGMDSNVIFLRTKLEEDELDIGEKDCSKPISSVTRIVI